MVAAEADPGHSSKSRPSITVTSRENPDVTTTEPRPNASEEDESAHHPKRRRVAKACHRCRRTKLRCDGAMPHCGTCLKAKKPCSYEPTVRKRGLKTGYVRVLECLWGLVFQSIEGSETAVELLISHTLRNGFWIGDEISRGPNSDEAPLERWRSSKVPRAIDALLTAGDDAADDEDMTTMLDLAQNKDTELNWALATQRLPSQPIEPPNFVPDIWYSTEIQEPVLKPGCSTAGPTQVLVTTPHVASEITQAILPELPQNTQRLLNRYFALTQSWFPIIERHAVYRSLFAYRKASAAGGDKQWTGGEDGILWAILAFSATARDFPQSEGDIATTGAREKFYMTARNTVPIEREDNYSISHVQTLLILGLFHYQACQWGVARLVVGQAILIAGHIGLDQLDAFSTDHRRRTWLGCFVLDTLTSANAQKAPRIQSHQVRALLPTEDTGNEEWEPWRLQEVLLPGVGSEMADIDMPTHALTVFNALLQLLCIVNDWMCSAAGGLHGDYGLALKTWWDSLPEHIKIIGAADPSSAMDMDTTSSASNPPSWNILNLSMVYAFLRKVLSCSLLPTSVECHDEQAWPPLIHATETLLSRFGQQALPAPINLLRTILTEEKAHDCSILELIECLKKQAFAQTQGDLGGQMTEYNPNFSGDHNANNAPTDTTIYNLASRIEENFTSFMDLPGPWPSIPAEILLDLNNVPDVAGSQQEQSIIVATGSEAVSSNTMGAEEAALGNFSDWDDAETDRELFRRNLGFTM